MNWLGVWDETTSYFKNDVVISPSTQELYILTELLTLTGGDDPSTPIIPRSPWTLTLRVSVSGVTSVSQGDGITIDNTNPLQPRISNAGVLSVTTVDLPTAGLRNDGTAADPLIVNNGVLQIIPGYGINTAFTENGTLVENTAILSIQRVGIGTYLTTGSSPTITNTGVTGLTPGDNISILDISGQLIVSANGGLLTQVYSFTSSMDPLTVPREGEIGILTDINPIGLLQQIMATGSPALNGGFVLDFSAWAVKLEGNPIAYNYPIPPFNRLIFSAIDSNTNTSFVISALQIGLRFGQDLPYPYPYISLPSMVLDIGRARAAGLRTISAITIQNTLMTPITLLTSGFVYGRYSTIK